MSTGKAPQGPTGNLMSISDEEFKLMRSLIYERVGINLTEQKRSLLVGRLQKLLRKEGFPNFKGYYEHLVSDKTEQALSTLVDLVSTNHTFFNREKAHFDYFYNTALPEVIQRLKSQNRRDLRIWCAGSSSGEEPYMLMMLMQEALGSDYKNWDAGLLATDISDRVLTIAKEGVYSEDKVALVPELLKKKYFRKLPGGDWAVSDQVKKEVFYRRFNLMNKQFPFKKPFDIIFCRNVMIYFDQPTRNALVQRFHQFTAPGGHLFIGHSESLGRSQSLYKYVMPALYQKELA